MMNKRTEQSITKVQGTDPNWLANYIEQDQSLQGMEEYRILPRIKVIQSMTDQNLKKMFGEGTIIIRPGDAVLWKDGDEPFLFVPLFFCVEFTKFADLRDKESGVVIVERSFDPTSDIAKKSRDSELRFEIYEGQEKKKDPMKYRYVEHLRFFGVIYGSHQLAWQFIALSFERGEFGQGRNFISAIKMRKTRIGDKSVPVPLWSQVWALKGVFRDKGDKKWYGIDFVAPDDPMINPGDAEQMFAFHKEMKELFEKQRLLVDEQQIEDNPGDSGEF